MIVVDASVALEIIIGTEVGRALAPAVISSEEILAPLATLAELPIERHPHDILLTRIWSLRSNLTAYDAAYVALAELLEAPLWTRDRRIAAAPGGRARVTLV